MRRTGPLSVVDPFGLDCMFLDSTGGMDTADGFEVDSSLSQQGCADAGGYYFDGTVDPGNLDIDPDSNWVGLTDDKGNVQQAACIGSACSFDSLSAMGSNYADCLSVVDDSYKPIPVVPEVEYFTICEVVKRLSRNSIVVSYMP